MQLIDEAPQRLAAADGDEAKLALANKLVDGLKTRDELRTLMTERGAADSENKTFRQVSFEDYLDRVKPRLTGDAVARHRGRRRDRRRHGAASARSAGCRPPTSCAGRATTRT